MASFEQLTDEQRLNLARVGHRLLHNPEVSKDARRLLMKADPSVKFPDLEVEETMQSELAKRDKKIDEMSQSQMQEAAERRRESCRQQARDRGLDPDEVEKAITERGIVKWETAMEHVEMKNRLATPTPDAGSGGDGGSSTRLPDGDDLKDFWNDPAAWANKQAHLAVDEIKQNRHRAPR